MFYVDRATLPPMFPDFHICVRNSETRQSVQHVDSKKLKLIAHRLNEAAGTFLHTSVGEKYI
ncbi:hypothetical protein SCH4B_3074 [Ruegeria sp. TrichCH4B]|nr:hypothetical protein SCH4B_3074 [Ruegeria sp. TrichCH4B]